MQIEDLPVLVLWAVAVVTVWSALSALLTGALIVIPAWLGWWRLAQALSVTLAIGFVCLSIMAIFGVPTGLALPTRPRAGVVVWPVMAIWPLLAAFF